VSNPPWDVQVAAPGGVDRLHGELLAQLAWPVRKGGRAVLLVEATAVVHDRRWALEQSLTVSVAGRHPSIVVLRLRH